MIKKVIPFVLIMLMMLLSSCTGKSAAEDEGTSGKTEVTHITMNEAKERFEQDSDYIILDVRTEAEYKQGHIPGAICVPNETISKDDIAELPDKEQLIFVYCRSGNRSRQAADKLAALGYTNVVEIGGIKDWEGEITL